MLADESDTARPETRSISTKTVPHRIHAIDAAPTATSRIWLPLLILAVYLSGVVWFGIRLHIGIWRAIQLVNSARVIDVPPNCRRIIGKTIVRESLRVRVPLTVGWRPTVLLPSDWPSWDESMLSAVLLHEQEHVRRRDQWIGLLAELNRAVYWFNPIAWFLRRRLSTLAEEACDDAVVASMGDRAGYARHLLTVAGRLANKSSQMRTATSFASASAIFGSAMPMTPQPMRAPAEATDLKSSF